MLKVQESYTKSKIRKEKKHPNKLPIQGKKRTKTNNRKEQAKKMITNRKNETKIGPKRKDLNTKHNEITPRCNRRSQSYHAKVVQNLEKAQKNLSKYQHQQKVVLPFATPQHPMLIFKDKV